MKNRRFSQRLSSLLLALLLILPLSGCGVQLLPADEPVGSADQGTADAPAGRRPDARRSAGTGSTQSA